MEENKSSEQSYKVLKEKQTKEQTNSNQSTPKIKIPRNRIERTSSDENLVTTSDEGPDSPQPSHMTPEGSPDGKRQKPESPQSPPPNSPGVLCFGGGAFGYGLSPSPPKFVSLEEIMKAANGVENMVLAHEIAVDNNFRIEKPESSHNSMEKRVKDMMHKAFWDILESQLNESPPNYKQAMVLLKEIRGNVLSILLPQHTRLQQEIEEILDLDLILQQADNGILDFQRYAQYVLSVCARLCAPVRDDKIRELTQTNEVVPLFKGIFELLDVMKLDMANFHIQQMRPHIQMKSIQYERQKFKEFLESQSKLSSADGLEFTKKWLKNSYESIDLSNETNFNVIFNKTLINAYLDLLTAERAPQESYPETLLLDASRINAIRSKVFKLSLIGSVFLVINASVGSAIQDLREFRDKLKSHLMVLIGDKSNDFSSDELKSQMISVALQVNQEIKTCLEERGFAQLDASKEKMIESQITDTHIVDNRLRKVVERRILEFIERVLSSPTAVPMQIPTGLSVLKEEMTEMTGQFVRIAVHNRAVFTEYYTEIITDLIPGITSSESQSNERDITIGSQ